jgi:hypothetical protein
VVSVDLLHLFYETYIAATQLKLRVKFIWTSRQRGIPSDEKVDPLAKFSINLPVLAVDSKPLNTKDAYDAINKFITGQWQRSYDNSATARHYKLIEPTISSHIKYTHNIREHKITITTFRREGWPSEF